MINLNIISKKGVKVISNTVSIETVNILGIFDSEGYVKDSMNFIENH